MSDLKRVNSSDNSPVFTPVSLCVSRWLFIHGVQPDMEKERCKKRPHSAQFTQKTCSPVCLVFVLSLPAWERGQQ